MANEEHVAIISQGAEVWNMWRGDNPEVTPDLAEAPLHGGNLSGAVLSDAKLRGASLVRANLSGAALNGADFSGATLCLANLTGANLLGADLSGANLTGANLTGADLSKANLFGAILSGAFLPAANLGKAYLSFAHLDGAYLGEANLKGANLGKANLRGAELSKANLTGAELAYADLDCAKLFRADLSEASFSWANLTGVDLTEANLTGADLSDVSYNRKALRRRCFRARGLDGCVSNPVLKRDVQDEQYIDAAFRRWDRNWLGRLKFRLWGLFDYGRSMFAVGVFALLIVFVFGTVYKTHPNFIHYGKHTVTPFTPFYFSFVTYTTLGFGDVSAGSLGGEILVVCEVILGYVTLGLLLAILANTIARRS